jgi:Chaperone of endosialidase
MPVRTLPGGALLSFYFISLALAIGCFTLLLPKAVAVVPSPDGGYPGGNTAEGQNALFGLTTGGYNTAVGFLALRSDAIGSFNTAIGAGTLLANTGDSNTAIGTGALLNNTTGVNNTANGALALISNTIGYANTSVGLAALEDNASGLHNTAVGVGALANNTIGSANTALGSGAGLNVVTADFVTCIGASVLGADVTNTTWIGGIYGTTTQSGTTAPVIVSNQGQLGTVASSERFKKDITTMEKASEAILSLRPVAFHYKTDAKGTPQFGLIAEEVAKVNPALVLPDNEGKPYSVRYDAVNAMLLNEFLKEHKTVQNLKKEIVALRAIVRKQDSKIQKVSNQLELRRSAPRIADNDQ